MDIEIKELTVKYEEKIVFDRFSISFTEGKITGIQAPSGWGKTTLLNSIIIKYKNASCCWQDLRLLEDETCFNNIFIPLSNTLKRKDAIEKTNEILEISELSNEKDQKVKSLSGGQKQRVALSRAISFPSEILLLDEPFRNLDSKLKFKLMNYIKELNLKEKRTVIFVTHQSDESDFLCDCVYKF